MQQQHTDEATSMRPRQAAQLLGIGESTLWRFIKERDDFPRPIKLGTRMTVLRRSDLIAWLDRQATAPSKG
jgi:prophage regulatory protein